MVMVRYTLSYIMVRVDTIEWAAFPIGRFLGTMEQR